MEDMCAPVLRKGIYELHVKDFPGGKEVGIYSSSIVIGKCCIVTQKHLEQVFQLSVVHDREWDGQRSSGVMI